MHMNLAGSFLTFLLFVGLTGVIRIDADTHLYAGAVSTTPGSKLYFSNGSVFDATLSRIALPQALRTNGLNAGYYRGDNVTFSALAALPENGGPIVGHASFGAWLAVQVVNVEGPEGGSFAFWEGDGESDLGKITFNVPVGTTDGTDLLIISENSGDPGSDPYGHIHGREFTTSLPGTYLVGFRVVDLSTNGPGGGPIHLPSDVLKVRFQAGPFIETSQMSSNRLTLSFRSPPGISNAVETAATLDSVNWLAVGAALRGNNSLQSVTLTNLPDGHRFYRLRQVNYLP